MEEKRYQKAAEQAVCCGKTVLLLMLSTLAGLLFRKIGFQETNFVLLYILAVFLTARVTDGYLWGMVSSVAATLTFNYFFTKPYHSLDVYDASYLLTFAVMTVVAFVTSTFTSREKENARKAREREEEARMLYQLTGRLSEARDKNDAAQTAAESLSRMLGCSAGFLCWDEEGKPEHTFWQQTENGSLVRRQTAEGEALKKKMEQLHEPCSRGEEFYDWPVYGGDSILGVIRIPVKEGESLLPDQQRFLHSLQECMSLALGRIYAVRKQADSLQQIQKERYRGNLLRAISHDLRTPLSGIMGTAEMLMDMSQKTDPRYGLAEGIHKDARWLHSLVENILSLTRLQEGKMEPKLNLEAAEEVVGSAVARMASLAPGREIAVDVPKEVLMVPMDAGLIMQVLINLLDNAVKHTGAEEEIRVSVIRDSCRNQAVFRVADRGEGIAPEDLPNIFETFYTSRIKPADARRGIGLGLAICDSIVRRHGGSMEAGNRTDGPGAEFIFRLPLAGVKPEEKKEETADGTIS